MLELAADRHAQDTGSGLRAIDRLADRPGFEGVYGPLYRLFEVEREEYNLAVELTAGNRSVIPRYLRNSLH